MPGFRLSCGFLSDGELSVSEPGDLEGPMFRWCSALFWLFVVVSGGAVLLRRAHVHPTGVFARAAAIRSHTSGPALAVAGGGSIRVLQGFVFDVGIGV